MGQETAAAPNLPSVCSNETRPRDVLWVETPESAPAGTYFNATFRVEPASACLDFRAVYLANRSIPARPGDTMREVMISSFGRAEPGEAIGNNTYRFAILAPLRSTAELVLRGVAANAGHFAWSEETSIDIGPPPPVLPDAGNCTRWPMEVSYESQAGNDSGPLRAEPVSFGHAGARCVVVLTSGCGFCSGSRGFGSPEHYAFALFENLRVVWVSYNALRGEVGFNVAPKVTFDPGELRSVLALSPRAQDSALWVADVRTGLVEGDGAAGLLPWIASRWQDDPPRADACADCSHDDLRYSPSAGELLAALADPRAEYEVDAVLRGLIDDVTTSDVT
ncbi:MAG TPA: hypothetical protein VGR28_10695 [Candidatus Thermoplasmatota archaeon]|nr:hypothetical protein [Candidatus Thermoplasmatota archaeon]